MPCCRLRDPSRFNCFNLDDDDDEDDDDEVADLPSSHPTKLEIFQIPRHALRARPQACFADRKIRGRTRILADRRDGESSMRLVIASISILTRALAYASGL